jgi:rhodanese-related sulfurtransferase
MNGWLRLVIVSGALALTSACSGGAIAPAITGDELAERIAAGDAPLVVDVRTPEEFSAGHVPKAINIPYDQIADRKGELGVEDLDREIVVYCESGRRAAEAESALRRAGFSGVRHLEGDMIAWRDARHVCVGC